MRASKFTVVIVCSLAILLLIAGLSYIFFTSRANPILSELVIGDQTVHVYVADTDAERELGLSGRERLAPDEGMLFVFPIEGKFSFWMKDMKFPIDILWLSNDGTVIYIEENVSPDSYPEQFAPKSGLARYVLELPAGFASAHEIGVGDKAEL